MTDETLKRQVRTARSQFVAMAAAYGLGTFNDSFFRQSAMLLAVAGGHRHMQGWTMAVFALPYLLFAAPAGWLADRFAKRRVVIAAKALELAAMGCGTAGILTGNWAFIMAMVFTMGLQSCLFSPALNGSIPELYPAVYVTRANAALKVVVTVAILTGISLSGLALSHKGAGWGGVSVGRWVVALTVVGIAAVGLLASLGVPRRPAAAPAARFPWAGPVDTLRQLLEIRTDRLLAVVVVADVFIWFIGSVLIPLINVLAMEQLGRGEDLAGYMVGAEVVGIAVGGVVGSRLAVGRRWHRVLPAGTLGVGAVLAAMPAVPALPTNLHLPAAFALLALAGIAGGLVLVPAEAFVQVRPAAHRKGAVIAWVNFAVFAGILLSGPVANGLYAALRPTTAFGAVAAAAVAMGLWLWRTLAKEAGE